LSQKFNLRATKYFIQTDIGRPFAYYRKRYEDGGLYEEIWQKKYQNWKHIPLRLIWMEISGECTLQQVSYEKFKELLPAAFVSEKEDK
jgi:hypothetical protein